MLFRSHIGSECHWRGAIRRLKKSLATIRPVYVFKVIDRIAILVDIRLSLYYKVFDIILGYQEVVPLCYTVGKG